MANADITNWRSPENIPWSFCNLDKVLQTDAIEASTQTKKDLSCNLQDFSSNFTISHPDPEKGSLDLESFLSTTETDALIVLKNDKVVLEKYGTDNIPTSKHLVMSITKSVTGLLVGILVSRGKIKVDEPVTTYIPELRGTSLEHATIRQCIDMRSGIVYDDWTPPYPAVCGWDQLDDNEEARTLHHFLSSLRTDSPEKVEGLEGWPFDYASPNADLMGWVLERVSGKTYATLVEELLWKPMDAESDAFITVDGEGSARSAGGLCATARDLARLGQLVLHGGEGVVPADWIEDMLYGGSVEAFAAGPWAPLFEPYYPGLRYRSFWLSKSEEGVLMGVGIHGQMLFVDFRSGIVMVKLSSQPDIVDMEKYGLMIEGFREFRRVLGGER